MPFKSVPFFTSSQSTSSNNTFSSNGDRWLTVCKLDLMTYENRDSPILPIKNMSRIRKNILMKPLP